MSTRDRFHALLKKAIGTPMRAKAQKQAPKSSARYTAKQTRSNTPGGAAKKRKSTSP